MALDEPGDDDDTFNVEGFVFCVNKELLQTVESISLDFGYMGFQVTPAKPLANAGSSACGGCSSSGSCAT